MALKSKSKSLFRKGSELDAWARALGVDNDDDALAALGQLMAKLLAAQEYALDVARATSGAPDADANQGARAAVAEIATATDAMVTVYRKFQRHQRGR